MKNKYKLTAVLLAALLVAGTVPAVLAAESEQEILLGDVTGDGVIKVNDATLIQKHIADVEFINDKYLEAGDVNGDGQITVKDATEIQKYLAGISVDYAIGEPINQPSETEPTTEAVTEPTTAPSTEATEPVEGNEDAWKANTGTIILSNSGITVTGNGIYVAGNTVYITDGGDWEVTGVCDNGMIYVNTGEEKDVNDKVKLRLNGMSLTNTSGPAIWFDRCKKAFITIEGESTNSVADSSVYASANAEAKGAIHSDDSLEIKGKGTLNVTGNYKHGINSDDDIVIENGIINITAAADGFHANDYITLDGKNIHLAVNAQSDGMESEGTLTINQAVVDITAGGKGIKAASDLNITGGNFTINSADDSIHSNANVTIAGGDFRIHSGDDGIHADTTLTVSGGAIDITKSYEGLEGNDVVIDGGTISVVASDDGINAAGGNDQSSMGGRPGQNQFRPGASSNNSITINGGYVFVTASGDGIDSNGAIGFNGGTVLVQGPSNGGNFSIDADGTVGFNGGTVMAVCSSNAMWEDINGKLGSAVYNKSIGNVSSGSVIAVTDASGSVLSALKSKLSGNVGIVYFTDRSASLSSAKIVTGGTYSGNFDSFGYGEGGTVSGGTTSSPSSGSSNPPGGGNPPGGRW